MGGVVAGVCEEAEDESGEEEEGEERRKGRRQKRELEPVGHGQGRPNKRPQGTGGAKQGTTTGANRGRGNAARTRPRTLFCSLSQPSARWPCFSLFKMGPSLCSPSLSPPHSAMSRRKNTKRLSLSLPADDTSHSPSPARRLSTASLPSAARPTSSLLHRMEEEGGSPTIPYTDGPVQIIPGVWLGSEDNARDWKSLIDRGIRSILNVAKEVSSPFDALAAQPLRSTASVPDLKSPSTTPDSTFYPPHIPSGRPGMHYLKLQWSHGQKDLVTDGFQAGIVFSDAALARGDGVLIQSVLSSVPFFLPHSLLQLSMRYLTLSYHGYRPRHAFRGSVLSISPTRGLESQGHAGRLCLCQRKKQVDWPKYVVCLFQMKKTLIQPLANLPLV